MGFEAAGPVSRILLGLLANILYFQRIGWKRPFRKVFAESLYLSRSRNSLWNPADWTLNGL
jgi:hypothetical protein